MKREKGSQPPGEVDFALDVGGQRGRVRQAVVVGSG